MASDSQSRPGEDIDGEATPDATRNLLLRSLLERYSDFKAKLTRVFGPELASDALQETWLRLQRPRDIAPVRDPDAYVYQAAANTARNLRVAHDRLLDFSDIAELFSVVDDAPGPEIIAGDRGEIARMEAALSELTERQREIFHEIFLGDQSHQALAERHRVTVRTIQKELKRAVEHCAKRLGKRKSFVSGRSELSPSRGENK